MLPVTQINVNSCTATTTTTVERSAHDPTTRRDFEGRGDGHDSPIPRKCMFFLFSNCFLLNYPPNPENEHLCSFSGSRPSSTFWSPRPPFDAHPSMPTSHHDHPIPKRALRSFSGLPSLSGYHHDHLTPKITTLRCPLATTTNPVTSASLVFGVVTSLVATTTLRCPLATTNPETSASLVFGVVTFLWSPPPPFDAH